MKEAGQPSLLGFLPIRDAANRPCRRPRMRIQWHPPVAGRAAAVSLQPRSFQRPFPGSVDFGHLADLHPSSGAAVRRDGCPLLRLFTSPLRGFLSSSSQPDVPRIEPLFARESNALSPHQPRGKPGNTVVLPIHHRHHFHGNENAKHPLPNSHRAAPPRVTQPNCETRDALGCPYSGALPFRSLNPRLSLYLHLLPSSGSRLYRNMAIRVNGNSD